jgi:site-specific recombinase XerD
VGILKAIAPDMFRHKTAVHLISAGVDVAVIRSWLGQSQSRYTTQQLQTGALEAYGDLVARGSIHYEA